MPPPKKEATDSDWMREKRKEEEHRAWLWSRLRGVGGWAMAALWLVVDGLEKVDKFIVWLKR